MARKLTIGVNWQGRFDFKALIERAKLADQAGIHSIWVAEAWGRDAFTLLTLLAEHTHKIQLATSIVNIYSRTPAALAQHFATLDEFSGGRMIIGLGTSGPQVIEHFHGVPFNPPLTRMRETVDIINLLIADAAQLRRQALQARARVHAAFRADSQAHPGLHRIAEPQERRVHCGQSRRLAAGDGSARRAQADGRRVPRGSGESRTRSAFGRGQVSGRGARH